jgi:hypothetical protein
MTHSAAPRFAGEHRPPLAETAQRALTQLAERSPGMELKTLRADELLTSGLTRLLPTRDGTLAIALVRPEDWELLPAWLELDGSQEWGNGSDAWRRLADELRRRDTDHLMERGRLLGLALAPTGPHRPPRRADLARFFPEGRPQKDPSPSARDPAPLVVDLSSLWAGPLCTHLLDLCGANVIKVESPHRPDGARAGNPEFYRLLNRHKRSAAIDLSRPEGRHLLTGLIERADIVIESSRPRALQQMDIHAESLIRQKPSLIWVSITGYGRAEPSANWIAFGDDAGVAGGLSDVMKRATGAYQFAGDAIADPLTGIHAALAAWCAWREERGGLIELALADLAAWCLAEETARVGEAVVVSRFSDWWHHVGNSEPASEYVGRAITGNAAELGADTDAVLAEIGIAC